MAARDSLPMRLAAMAWLDRRTRPQVDYKWLSTFVYEGERIPLLDSRRGIRKPAGIEEALAIRTAFTPPGHTPIYNDSIGTDGLQRYKYQGEDPTNSQNVALRLALERQTPLIWFVGIAAASYEPIYPVWVVADDPLRHEFVLALDPGQRFFRPGEQADPDTREYLTRLTKQRLHQRVFRSQILLAYDGRCTVCNLGHVDLLDAAHIIADGQPHGQPITPNGLAMCKIHHAAFDSRILGVRPDLSLHVRQDILDEVDGPMLRHGLQEMHNRRLMKVPIVRASQPDRGRLEERYAEFLDVG